MREKREEKTVTKDSKIFIDEKEGKRGEVDRERGRGGRAGR